MRPGTQPAPSTAAAETEPRRATGTHPRFTGLLRLADERPRRCFGLLFALFFTMLLAWGMGTPLQSAPDEWSHLFRAAQVYDGQFVTPTHGPMNVQVGDRVRVPEWLVADRNAALCFFRHADVPVTCAKRAATNTKIVLSNSPASRYPPVYYAAVGWPLIFSHGDVAVYLIRIVAGALSSIFLAWGLLIVLRLGIGLASAGFVLAVTPMVSWLSTMINPNGMEIAAAFTLWPGLILWLRGRDRIQRRAGAVAAGTAATVMLLSRSVSALWVIVAVVSVLPLLRSGWLKEQIRSRAALSASAAVVIAGTLTLAWSAIAHQTQLTRPGLPQHHTLWENMLRTGPRLYRLWMQAVAYFGWLDTPLPQHYYLLFELAVALLLVCALLGAFHGGARIAVSGLIAAGLTLVVTVVMAAEQANVLGFNFWQGRYSLPMGVGVPILFGYAARGVAALERSLAAVVALLVGVAAGVLQVGGFKYFFHRNSVGTLHHGGLFDGWQPPGGVVVWLVLLTASTVGLTAVAVLATLSRPAVEVAEHTEQVPALGQ